MSHVNDDELVLLHYREDAGPDAEAHVASAEPPPQVPDHARDVRTCRCRRTRIRRDAADPEHARGSVEGGIDAADVLP